MLIVVKQDVIEKAINSKDIDNKIAINTLKKVLLSVKWRKHIVFAPDLTEEDIQKLEGNNNLTPEELELLKYVHSKRQNSYGILGKLSHYVILSFCSHTHIDNKNVFINPNSSADFELYEETHLITENILDSEFYSRAICNYFLKTNKLGADCFYTSFYPVQGGGATIADVLNCELDMGQHFCFAIVDSDKKYADCKSEGDTAKGIRKTVKEYEKNNGQKPFHIGFYVMSKVREIENLIPFCILELFSNNTQKVFLEQHSNVLSFFDMKVGLEYKILYDNDVYKGWKKAFPNEVNWAQIDTFKANSTSQKDFEEKTKNLSKLVDEWGSTILKKVLNPKVKKQKDAIYKLFEIKEKDLTPDQKEEWDNISKYVFSWCCCFKNPPR